MTIAEMFEITAEQRAQLDVGPFRGADEKAWNAFAAGVHEQVLKAYAEGEIALEGALRAVLSCSLGCSAMARATLLAVTARRAIDNPPTEWKGKRPPNPAWVRYSAATLVEMLHEARPEEPLAPNEMNGYSTRILDDAIKQLVALGLCEPIDQRTLYTWYLAYKKTLTTLTTPPADQEAVSNR